MLNPGNSLQNRYHIQRILGSGGFATVYLAEDSRLRGRQVAIKEFTPSQLPTAEQVWASQSFQQEASVLARLSHPGIANVTDFFTSSGMEYLVIEYVHGETLTQAWQRVPGHRFSESQVLEWARQLCVILNYLHEQTPPIIFRDLKPDNIMVQPDGQLKVIDFGIVRYFKPGQTRDTQAMGTPGYASPEQYGQGQTDARSDIYSLAAVMHQLLTGHDPGQTPMTLPDITAVNPQISSQTAAAIQQALQINPNQRFNSIAEFAAALGLPLSGGLGGSPPPVPPISDEARKGLPTWAIIAIAVFSLLLAAVALFAASQTLWSNDPTPLPLVDVPETTPPIVIITNPPEPTATAVTPTTTSTDESQAVLPTATPTPLAEGVPIQPPTDTPPPTDTNTPEPTLPPTATATPTISWRSIVFDSTRDDPHAEIYIMNPDGSSQRRLTSNQVQDDDADLSPDQRWIVFDHGASGSESVWLMNVDGSGAEQLVNIGRLADWSPDGGRIAYETGDPSQIWTMDLNSGVRQQITSGDRAYRAPDWSSDGSQIVAMSRFGESWQIVIINVATGGEIRITAGEVDKRFPAWSPDGEWIAYNTLNSSGWPDDVWVIRPSGDDARSVTNEGNNGRPTWSPDSQTVVYNGYDGDKWLLYEIGLDGTGEKPVTTVGSDQRASWGN